MTPHAALAPYLGAVFDADGSGGPADGTGAWCPGDEFGFEAAPVWLTPDCGDSFSSPESVIMPKAYPPEFRGDVVAVARKQKPR